MNKTKHFMFFTSDSEWNRLVSEKIREKFNEQKKSDPKKQWEMFVSDINIVVKK